MKIILIIISVFAAGVLHAQEVTTSKDSVESPLVIVEQMPEFVGGESARIKFIVDNIEFPKAEQDAGVTGTCYVTFVVEKDGSLSDIHVLRGVPNGPGYDKESVRVISMMPKWIPGKQNGKAVRTQFNLPIKFTLRNRGK